MVVVGYGSVKKRDLTGSVSQISSSSIQNQAVMKDPMQALQGKIAGADITMGNSPGASSTIVIRGYNSINAGNDPLIVVDDAPFGGKIDEINPAEIESIDVLKDASSTAIYGSRGANGVVIITTKRARKEAKLSVSYDGYVGVSKSFKNYDMMSGEKYADWKRMANYGKTDKEIFDDIQLKTLNSGQFVDWQDLMFSGTGYKTDHNVSINQSNGRNRNMLVLGYNKDQSIIDNMGYERFSARINGDMELAKNLTVGYSSLLALTTRNNGDNSVWKYGTVIDPLTEVYDENGDMRFYNSGWYQTVLHSNPLFDTDKNNVDNKEKRTRILLNLFADWEIIKGLKFRTSLTYGLSSIENGVYKSSTSQARQLASPSAEYKKKIPKWTAGLSTGFYYKNFDLNVYFYTRQKYGQLLGVLTDEAGSTRYNHLDVDFWTPDNPSNACPKPAITNPQELLVSSDYAYRDLSFIRLKNINLGYTLPKEISKKFYSEKFRVYFMVENPYTWTKSDYVGLDPENCNSYTDHRPLTSFIFGVNASF